jgi:hypothetical protein
VAGFLFCSTNIVASIGACGVARRGLQVLLTLSDTEAMSPCNPTPLLASEPVKCGQRMTLPVGVVLLGLMCMTATPSWGQARNAEPARSSNAPQCWVADFRALALTTHQVADRERKALDWLQRYARACTDEQLLMLASNRPAWLGHADTAKIAGAIDKELERRYVAGRGSVGSLFDSPEAKSASTEITTTPAAPSPVVPAAAADGVPAAVVVQQPSAGN